ncbi:unnamed protein product [Lepidochelys olivacea]
MVIMSNRKPPSSDSGAKLWAMQKAPGSGGQSWGERCNSRDAVQGEEEEKQGSMAACEVMWLFLGPLSQGISWRLIPVPSCSSGWVERIMALGAAFFNEGGAEVPD